MSKRYKVARRGGMWGILDTNGSLWNEPFAPFSLGFITFDELVDTAVELNQGRVARGYYSWMVFRK